MCGASLVVRIDPPADIACGRGVVRLRERRLRTLCDTLESLRLAHGEIGQ